MNKRPFFVGFVSLSKARSVRKIEFIDGNSQASISQQPQDVSVIVGTPATFSVQVSRAVPTEYGWQRRTGLGQFTNIANATSSSYTVASPTLSDNNAEFRVIVTTSGGNQTA